MCVALGSLGEEDPLPRHHGEDGHGVVVVSVIFVSVLIGEVCCKRDQRQHTQDGLQHGSHLWTYRLAPHAAQITKRTLAPRKKGSTSTTP